MADPAIKAVGFTGSQSAGIALMRTAAARPEPIPVYAEMSSLNPVFVFPGALTGDAGSHSHSSTLPPSPAAPASSAPPPVSSSPPPARPETNWLPPSGALYPPAPARPC